MLRDVLEVFFGLTDKEIRIPLLLGFQLLHNVNQLVMVTPMEAVNILLEVVSRVPFFDGDGKIASYSKDLNRNPDKIYSDWSEIVDYTVPSTTTDGINRVVVQFLSVNLDTVEGPYQVLGSASVTTGFFRPYEKLDCYWSEDRRLRAKDTQLKILQSVNAGLLPVGSESYEQIDDFHGQITVEISIWVPILVTVLMMDYIYGQMRNVDFVKVPSFGVWPTIPVGRMASAADLIAILIIMASIGTGRYEVWGIPYEMAYVEKQAIAEECDLEYWERNEKKIENDLFGTYEQAMPVAINELIWEKSNLNKRTILVQDDPSLEIGDIIMLPDGRRYCITNMSKTVKRGETPLLNLETFKILIGSQSGLVEV